MSEFSGGTTAIIQGQISQSPPYQYQRLSSENEIRLLKIDKFVSRESSLEPESTQSQQNRSFPVHQVSAGYPIVHVHLESAPEYEAVSYVWGNPHRSHTINLIDGRILPVTASVAWALPYLVHACQTGYLWIDQITIDQSTLAERNHQVKIMGEIYRRSSRCLIWVDNGQSLGIESEIELAWDRGAGEEVRRFLQSFSGEEIQHLLQSFGREEIQQLLLPFPGSFQKKQLEARDHLLWFLEHPWFRRT